MKIKNALGKLIYDARRRQKLSRAALGFRLGVSPKTIQSWEMGRTFVENLELLPSIEAELDISVGKALAEIVDAKKSGSADLPSVFAGEELLEDDEMSDTVQIPILNEKSAEVEPSKLGKKDVKSYLTLPERFIPNNGMIVGYRVSDTSMEPFVTRGAVAVVNRRITSESKIINHAVALKGKKIRFRKLIPSEDGSRIIGEPLVPGKRGRMFFSPEEINEIVLGKVVCLIGTPL